MFDEDEFKYRSSLNLCWLVPAPVQWMEGSKVVIGQEAVKCHSSAQVSAVLLLTHSSQAFAFGQNFCNNND